MQPIQRSKLVWVILNAGISAGAQVRFPDVPELRGKKVVGLETYPDSMLSNTPDMTAVVTGTDAVGLTLVFKDASEERHQDLPFTSLAPVNTSGVWKQVTPFPINWQSSFVRVTKTPITLPVSVPVMIFYLD
jgi:hypothetical protein